MTTTTADAAEALLIAVSALASVDLDRLTDDGLLAGVVAVQRHLDMVSAELLRRVAEVDDRQAYRASGAVDTAAWLRSATGVGAGGRG